MTASQVTQDTRFKAKAVNVRNDGGWFTCHFKVIGVTPDQRYVETGRTQDIMMQQEATMDLTGTGWPAGTVCKAIVNVSAGSQHIELEEFLYYPNDNTLLLKVWGTTFNVGKGRR